MKLKMKDEAVSPVIGVILMVAITVILAAVIASFVFGMAGSVQTTKTVAVTAQLSDDEIQVTVHGGADIGQLDTLNASVNGETQTTLSDSPTTGTTATVLGGTGDRIMVIGIFTDGTEQILLDKQF